MTIRVLEIATGRIGPAGPTGPAGSDGGQGPPGGGFPGTDGDPGEAGPPGVPGSPGAVGATGAQGIPGLGAPGSDGDSGESGPPGPPGTQGLPGVDGTQGPPGFGAPGTDGMDGEPGTPGVQGPTGPGGPAGLDGAQGVPGLGIPGDLGEQGDSGFPGIPGPQGSQGINGIDGLPGAIGIPGMQGDPGDEGPPGPPGANGTGLSGVTGPTVLGLLTGTATPVALLPQELARIPRYSNQVIFTAGGTNNDFNPTGWADVDELLIITADVVFTGFAAPTTIGKRIKIRAAVGRLATLNHNNTSSTGINRILCPNSVDFLCGSNQAIELEYQNTTSAGTNPRWVVTSIDIQVAANAPLAVSTVNTAGLTQRIVTLQDGIYGDVTVTGGTNWTVNKNGIPGQDGQDGDEAMIVLQPVTSSTGGSVSFTDTIITLPYSCKQSDTVAVVDALIGTSSKLMIAWGTVLDSDENAPDTSCVSFTAVPAAGSMTVKVSNNDPLDRVGGVYKIRYLIG